MAIRVALFAALAGAANPIGTSIASWWVSKHDSTGARARLLDETR